MNPYDSANESGNHKTAKGIEVSPYENSPVVRHPKPQFRFNKAEEGRTLSKWGAQLSWISIGVSVLLLLILIIRAATATG